MAAGLQGQLVNVALAVAVDELSCGVVDHLITL
jgi:hypothetical protein